VRLEIRRSEQIKNATDIIGNKANIKVVKNKVAPPFKTVSVDIIYGQGISKVGELVDLASNLDIIQKSGAWFAYNGEKIGQGRENAKQYLADHQDVYDKIFKQVLDYYKISYKK
ncbi:MAG: DNA recombination/repair protein RecA, partial [Acholeplasmataceae bacterium]|nr:DNA recombination/repair protein RecA [Acholeplasmataceae bacterium]